MTLYYSLVFALLVFEMTLFMALILPMPFTWKRALFTFLSENPVVAQMQYWLKIVFVFVLILFIDSVNRVYRVQMELASAGKVSRDGGTLTVGSERMEVQARKFYSQRNMYLCGFTIFLSLILNRQYLMILDVLRLEEENKRLKGDSKANGKSSSGLEASGDMGEIGKLKKQLEQKDKDIEALKKQAEGLSNEYHKLGSQQGVDDGSTKKDR